MLAVVRTKLFTPTIQHRLKKLDTQACGHFSAVGWIELEFVLKKLPAKAAAWLMPLLLSLFMSGLVSLIATLHANGISMASVERWPSAWLFSWLVAFPVLLLVMPMVKKLVGWLTEAPGQAR